MITTLAEKWLPWLSCADIGNDCQHRKLKKCMKIVLHYEELSTVCRDGKSQIIWNSIFWTFWSIGSNDKNINHVIPLTAVVEDLQVTLIIIILCQNTCELHRSHITVPDCFSIDYRCILVMRYGHLKCTKDTMKNIKNLRFFTTTSVYVRPAVSDLKTRWLHVYIKADDVHGHA